MGLAVALSGAASWAQEGPREVRRSDPAANCAMREVEPTREQLQAALARLVGLWEAQEKNNRWRMEVKAEPEKGRVVGILVRQGKRSREVGFSVGEHVFTAWIAPDRAAVLIDQKWRTGRDGKTFRMNWIAGELDLCRSNIDRLVTRAGYVYRRIEPDQQQDGR